MRVHVDQHLDVLFLYIAGRVRVLGQWRRRAAEAGEHDAHAGIMERTVSSRMVLGDILMDAPTVRYCTVLCGTVQQRFKEANKHKQLLPTDGLSHASP